MARSAMNRGISVCHVVNAVGDTSMPGDIAAREASHEAIGDVGVLAWFRVDPFPGSDGLELSVLDVPGGRYRITMDQYCRLKEVLSGYDVVHTHHPHSGLYGKLVARRLGKPVVTTEHNDHAGYTRLGRLANGVTNPLADRVVCVSESVRDSFRRWERLLVGGVDVVHNGVNLDRVRAASDLNWSIHDVADVDPEALVVGTAGSLTEQKAQHVLVDAVDAAIDECRRPMELVISGDGERRDELERQIARSNHPECLHLLGFLETREHVYRMMEEIDVYAMPSRWEGLCVAAIEAMAVGNPCVFSDIDAFRRPFGHVARFHLVDDADALARLLVELAEDDGAREELAGRGRAEVEENYSLSVTVDEYVDVYRSLLGSR